MELMNIYGSTRITSSIRRCSNQTHMVMIKNTYEIKNWSEDNIPSIRTWFTCKILYNKELYDKCTEKITIVSTFNHCY